MTEGVLDDLTPCLTGAAYPRFSGIPGTQGAFRNCLVVILLVCVLSLLTTSAWSQTNYGACDAITFGISPAISGSDPYGRILQKIIERLEIRGGGDVYSNTEDMQDVLTERTDEEERLRIAEWLRMHPDFNPTAARYQLAIVIAPTSDGESVVAEIQNVETCEILITERIPVNGPMRASVVNQAAQQLWNALTSPRRGSSSASGSGDGRYPTITARLRAELSADTVGHDHSSPPRYHPVSPKLSRKTVEVRRNGELLNDEYRPGDVLEIRAKYDDCDGQPIRNLRITLDVLEGAASLAASGSVQSSSLDTDDAGKVQFQVWTAADVVPGTKLRLRLSSRSNCQAGTLLRKTIALIAAKTPRPQPHREAGLKGEFTVAGVGEFGEFRIQGTLTIQFEATWRQRAQLVKESPGPNYYAIIGSGTARQQIVAAPGPSCLFSAKYLPAAIPVRVLGWPTGGEPDTYELHFYGGQRPSILPGSGSCEHESDPSTLWKVCVCCSVPGRRCTQSSKGHWIQQIPPPRELWARIRLHSGTYAGKTQYVRLLGGRDEDPYTLTLTVEPR